MTAPPPSPHSPLPPLWMERQTQTDFASTARALTDWRRLEAESEAWRSIIARGQARRALWPPADEAWTAPFFTAGPWRRSADAAWSSRHISGFSRLPTVGAYIEQMYQLNGGDRRGVHDPKWVQLKQLIMHRFFQLHHWRRHGRRVFVLDADTYRTLAAVPVPKLPARVLRPPLPAFYILLPRGAFEFSVSEDDRPQPVEGVLVVDDDETEAHSSTPGQRELFVLTTGKSLRDDPGDDNLAYGSIALHPDAPLADVAASTAMVSSIREGRLREALASGDAARAAVHIALLGTGQAWDGEAMNGTVPRLILNLMLYLQSEHPNLTTVRAPALEDVSRMQNPAKRRKAEQRNARLSRLDYIHVGLPEPRELPAGATPATGQGTGRQLEERQVVRWHYKQQPHGPGGAARKLIRVEGYERGPQMDEALRLTAQRVPRPKERAS